MSAKLRQSPDWAPIGGPDTVPFDNQASKRGKFADAAIGYAHIDISELRLAQGKLNMFLAIDRVPKFTGRPSSETMLAR